MLAAEGVRRIVISHWTPADLARIRDLGRDTDLDVQLAGGANDFATVEAARDAGAQALILGEALFTGAVDYVATTQRLREEGAQPVGNG